MWFRNELSSLAEVSLYVQDVIEYLGVVAIYVADKGASGCLFGTRHFGCVKRGEV